MADEEEQDEGEKELTRREARIQELSRRNAELEKLINMDRTMQETARVNQQTAQAVGHLAGKFQQPADDPEDKWTPFLKPKMGKILSETLQPYQTAIVQLADKNDLLETMMEFPEYRDPELRQEVEVIRNARAQQTGIPEPRQNILTFLRGRNPEKFAGRNRSAATEDSPNRADEQNIHVESQITTSPNRAVKGKTLDLNTATAADIEKWAVETGFGKQLI